LCREFSGAVEEHRSDNDEILPHVLYGDLTRFVVAAAEEGHDELVRRVLAFLEDELAHGDEMVQNLVAVSFVENVGPFERSTAGFIATWPPGLKAEADRQREWRQIVPTLD